MVVRVRLSFAVLSSKVLFVAGGGRQRRVVVLELPHLLGHGQVAFFHGQLVFGRVDGQTLSAAAVPQLFGLQKRQPDTSRMKSQTFHYGFRCDTRTLKVSKTGNRWHKTYRKRNASGGI